MEMTRGRLVPRKSNSGAEAFPNWASEAGEADWKQKRHRPNSEGEDRIQEWRHLPLGQKYSYG